METRTRTRKEEKAARDRILDKAEELFYRQGYHATGINQIIEESDVAKATFYTHFPSKDDLCLAYLTRANAREIELLKEAMAKQKTPVAKFLCTAEMFPAWLEDTDFKGCTFLNMVPEIVNPRDPIRKEAAAFYAAYEQLIRGAAEELIASDKKKYGHLNPARLAKDYMTIVAGALELSALHHTAEPMRHGVRMLRERVE